MKEWVEEGVSIAINISSEAADQFIRVIVPEQFKLGVIRLINEKLETVKKDK